MDEPWKYVNVERFFIVGAEHIDVLTLIQKLPKLKELRLIYSKGKSKILQLKKLNDERAKVAGGRRVTIYVKHKIYQETKWNVEHGNMNLPLIEMKRMSAKKWCDYEREIDDD